MFDPDVASAIKDMATSIAIIFGGLWAIWKWGFSEKLRRKREMCSPDGYLKASSIPINEQKVVITLEATWRNRGQLPIKLDVEHTLVEVYEINSTHKLGRLGHNIGQINLLYSIKPFSGVYIMEPNTDSQMHEHFVLSKKCLYLFRWIIGLSRGSIPGKDDDAIFICVRELIWRYYTEKEDQTDGA